MPDDVTGAELDRSVRAELSALRPETGREVARHLVMTGRLLDEDPETAWRHAVVARDKAARLASVREAVGLAAYSTGRYAEALAELRTVRRLTGSNVHLPVMADCERGLGRPERALALAVSPEAHRLDLEGQVEMLIVAAGARSDLGQDEAAVVTLQVPELKARTQATWLARLRSAYSDALAAVGRADEAAHWMQRALDADVDGEAGIAERLADDDGLVFDDLYDGLEDEDDIVGDGEDEGEHGSVGDGEAAGAADVVLPVPAGDESGSDGEPEGPA
ncbi:MAG: hypothetical protein ACKVZ6_02960 [Kineosporiaceae bacterium]